jgi:hypothetical protein
MAKYMRKKNKGWSLILLILLAPALALTLWQATGRADQPSPGKSPGAQQSPSKEQPDLSAAFQGTVAEIINPGRHIYVRIDTGKQQVWVAVPSFDGKPGDAVLVPPGVPVANFQSRKLHRKFKLMIFVGGIRRVRAGRSN